MPDITVYNDKSVDVVSTIAGGKLLLSVNDVVIGVVTDEFSVPAPVTMRLFIRDLPDGTPIAAQWQPASGGPWWAFTPAPGGVFANFPIPPVGAPSVAYNFIAVASEHGIYVHDPRLVLKTRTSAQSSAAPAKAGKAGAKPAKATARKRK
jgi:hypothetical protein